MEIGIVGISQSGKSSLFRALAGAEVSASGRSDAHIAVVKVPDARLDILDVQYQPKKKVPAEFKILDFAPMGGKEQAKGFSSRHLAELRNCDALLLCIRAFHDEAVAHPDGAVDAGRDLETLYLEFALADLDVVQRRIERIEASLPKSSREERELLQKERPVLERIGKLLEGGGQAREELLAEDQKRLLRGYGLLTEKPIVIALNIDESGIGKTMDGALPVRRTQPVTPVVTLCAKLEMELAAMDPEEQKPFLEDAGLAEPARGALLRAAWETLGLICFFTVGEDEVRAWPVRRGDSALIAAGKIHSDIARGFIRAEVMAYDDFQKYGGAAGVKEHGRFRLEGKEYIVADGDMVNFRFNV